MEFVEPDDEPQQYRQAPPPDDRLWRHPSEIRAERYSVQRRSWTAVVAYALAATLLPTGLAAVAWNLSDTYSGAVSPVVSGSTADLVSIADRVAPAIAWLKVDGPRGGRGWGAFIRSDGHVVTSAHVVDGATSVAAVLSSGREVAGRVIGTDPDTDTAVVKVDGGPFPVADLGSTTGLRLGQKAIAIVSPLDLNSGPALTVGVVSGMHRTVATLSGLTLFDMVQTDAPIAGAPSGGVLLDARGRVIGITTAATIPDAGGFAFATPIDTASWAAEQLITTGRVVRTWLGVEGVDLDGASAQSLGPDGGAIIERVRADSPAERAGLAARDVIVGVNGTRVTSMRMLIALVRSYRPGQVCTLDIVRDNQHQAIQVVMAARPLGS